MSPLLCFKKSVGIYIRPVLFDTLAAIYVTLNMLLMHCFYFTKSYNDFSFQTSTFSKTITIKTAEKEHY